MKNHLFYGIFFVALVFAAPSLRAQASPSAEHRHHGPMPAPKNLQVLPKDIAHQDLMQVMRGFTGALGVECGFCHVIDMQAQHADFASDAKPTKNIARAMMRMTHTINSDYLAKIDVSGVQPNRTYVTCGTCHRGQSIPATFIPPKQEHHT